MKSIRNYMSYAPKKMLALGSILAAAIIVPAATFAWGPSRTTYTTAAPAAYITFNSIVDNPVQGDERNFMQIKDATVANSTYVDSINLAAGKKYTVFMYYHNDAAANLNLVATDTYARAELPAVVASGSTNVKAIGYIGASNAYPNVVWDDVNLSNTTGSDIALHYVAGSAHIYNQGATNGATLSDNIITTGATLGYDSLNGQIPGCNQYAGYVTFDVVADQPNFVISKSVRLLGTTTWSKSVNAKAGDHVEYQIAYNNTGTTTQNNVILKDSLPAGETYVAGSSWLKNATYPNAKNVSDNLVSSTGINIGNYTSGSNAFLKFEAIIGSNQSCNANTIVNTASALTDNGSKSDTANVVAAGKTCVTPVNELPKTGASDVILSTLGLGTLSASTAYYVASRKRA